MTIFQTSHGFILSQETDFDPKNPKEITVAENTIPAINLTKPYNDYSGKSVLEIVEKLFTEPPIEKT